MLLKRNANVNVKSISGVTALFAAVKNDYENIVELLLNSNANPNVKVPNLKSTDFGCKELATSCQNVTPLIIATKKVNTNIVKLLLDNGAHINMKDDQGRTALDWAKKRDNDVILEDGYGRIALDWDKIRDNKAIIKLISSQREKLFWQYLLSDGSRVLISPLLLTLRIIPDWHF